MESWAGGARQLDASWTANISTLYATAGGPHLATPYEWFPTKWPQSSGKIPGMLPLLTWTFLPHYIVTRAREVSGFFFFFSPQDRWWQVIWVQAGGGLWGEERGPDGKFLSHLCVQWGVVANVSGDTQISWHVQRFSVYFETCRRLCRGEECSLSLVLSVQSDKTLSMRLICFNAQPTICVPLQSLSLCTIWLHSGVSGSNWSWQSCVTRGGDTLQYACFI